MADLKTPLVAIAGWKDSGKTTLVTKLVEAFTAKGLKVATIKHTHHELTNGPGNTDSERHAGAGAAEIAIISPSGLTIIPGGTRPGEPSLKEAVSRLAPADLIIVEGFKSEPVPKIEVRRRAQAEQRPLAGRDPRILAIATDHPVDETFVPVFALDDTAAIAAIIEKSLGLTPAR